MADHEPFAGMAQEVTLSSIDDKLVASTSIPDNQAQGLNVRPIGQDTWSCSFSDSGGSILSSDFITPVVGAGVTFNQTAGVLNIVGGTTANKEFLTRSTKNWRGVLALRYAMLASQRIANTNMAVILADLIGEGLAVTVNSATSISVTKAAHGYTAANVGQFMFVGGITSVNGVPGRYAIASIPNADTINFTVAGWPASGSGTVTLFGHSHVKQLYAGTVATNVAVDAQRKGWASGDTTLTTLTSAGVGHILQAHVAGREIYWSDTLRASTTAPAVVVRGSRLESLPDDNLDLHLFLWCYNGTTNPASSTTWSISFIGVEKFVNLPVYVQGQELQGGASPAPVAVQGTVPITGSVTAAVNNASLAPPVLTVDVVNAALTTTATTATIAPANGQSYSVNIPVTAASGTNPTLDVSIEESLDGGTNWFKVYDFPRIVATGIYSSPLIPQTGTRVRYVQTVGGTTPSFTRTINRLQSQRDAAPIRQMIDRSVSLTTLGAVTPSLDARDCGNRLQLVVNIGGATTPPALQLEGSDDNGASWYAIGSPLAAVANSTVQLTVANIHAALVRAKVSTAGAGVTMGYVMIKAHD